jgi:CO/xanthine dehydrogenase FAD-binding subunit
MTASSVEAQYFLPNTAEEAVALKSTHPGASFVGGATLVMSPLWGHRPRTLIDLSALELKHFTQGDDQLIIGGGLSIDALMHLDALKDSQFNAIREAAYSVEPDVIRRTATVAGNLSYRSGTLATAFSLYGAEVQIMGSNGVRSVALEKLDAGPDELIMSLHLTQLPSSTVTGFRQIRRTPLGPGVAQVAVSIAPECTRLIVGAVTPTLESFEFVTAPGEEELASVLWHGLVHPISDERASALYRVAMAAELSLRLIEELSNG